MRKLVRTGVFETNSSSSHSLTLSESGTFDSITPDDDGVIRIKPGDFGWAIQDFHDPKDKLSYVMIYIRDWMDRYARRQLQNDKKALEGPDGPKLSESTAVRLYGLRDVMTPVQLDACEKLRTLVLEHTGATDIVFVNDDDRCFEGGYIDHQSVEGEDLQYLFDDMAKMKDFIFGRGSYLTTDNDNH